MSLIYPLEPTHLPAERRQLVTKRLEPVSKLRSSPRPDLRRGHWEKTYAEATPINRLTENEDDDT